MHSKALEPVAAAEQPLFVIGAQRSGTTLLRLMFAAHPQVSIPPESLFFVSLEPKYGDVVDLQGSLECFLDDLYSDVKFREWSIEREVLRQNLRALAPLSYSEAVSTIYQTYSVQSDPEAQYWGDKNPEYLFHVDTIFRHFPDAHVVHIIRDVRAVYNSIKSLTSRRIWRDPRNRFLLVTRRLSQVAQLVDEYSGSERLTNVRYEQLASNPEEQLARLCTRIELDFDESMLDFHQRNVQEQLVPKHRLAWHERTLEPVSRARVEAWQDDLDLAEIEALELLNSRNMRKLGYACVTSPWRYRGVLRLTSESIRSGVLRIRRAVARLVRGRSSG